MLFGLDKVLLKQALKKIIGKEVNNMPTQGQVRKYGTIGAVAGLGLVALGSAIGIDTAALNLPGWTNTVLTGIGLIFQLLKKD
jgi:hypothetical protein